MGQQLLRRVNQPSHSGQQQQQSSPSTAEPLQTQHLLSILDKPRCPAQGSHGENIPNLCVSLEPMSSLV